MSSLLNKLRPAACVLSCLLLCPLASMADEQPATAESQVSYYQQVLPIFQAKCQGCHQPAKPLGEYVMTSFPRLLSGGETGEPAIVPGKADESYLIQQITPVDGQAEMPREGQPLAEREIALVRAWIAQGAVDDTPASRKRIYDAEHPPTYVRPPVITSIDYSPDGKLLAVAGFHEVLLHEVAEDGAVGARPVARLIGVSERIEAVRFSPDGAKLAVAGGTPGRSGEVQIWDVATKQLDLSAPVSFDTVRGVSWSPDQTMIAFGCADSTVRAIDAASGEQVLYQGSHEDWVLDTVFSTDGSHLVSVAGDMTAKLIEVETQRFVDNITSITPKALTGGINGVARHPNRDQILFGGADGVPKIYRMHRITPRKIGDDANQLWELPALPGRVFSVDYNQDGSLIAAGSSLNGKGAIHVYRIDPEFDVPKDISEILIKPTHTRSAEEVGKLKQYFADGVETLAKISVDAGIYAVSISPDGRRVVASGSDGTIRVVDPSSGEIETSFVPVEIQSRQVAEADEAELVAPRDETPTLDPRPVPENVQVAAIRCEPATIKLQGPNAYVQLLVSAETVEGDTIDVTRLVTWRANGDVVQVSSTGTVTPANEGKGVLELSLGNLTTTVDVQAAGLDQAATPDYIRDVMPVVSRLGCNAGTCHGAKDGKNGFKLSLRGYDPVFDVRALADDLCSRRVNVASPDDSLMLLKSTARSPHEGGQVTKVGAKYYRILRDWIAGGATLDLTTPRVTGIEVYPMNPVVQRVGARQQMRVIATYADGVRRDVTAEAFVESGNTDIVKPAEGVPALMSTLRRGEAPILVRFEGAYASTTITVMGDRTGFVWQQPPSNIQIDDLVADKLKRTKTLPSPLCDDYEFIRRAYLDLTGLPPSPEQIREFVSDNRDSRWKRDQLIDKLVGNEEFVEHWTNKWADLLQVNGKYLGSEGAATFRAWIRGRVERNTPYDQFVRQILTATGSNKDNPPASYFKILRSPEETMENTTHLFLATRFNCNKCHDHPFERWTQNQYYEMAAFFARVGLKKDPAGGDRQIGRTAVESGKPLYEVVFDKDDGEVRHDRTGEITPPEFPYAATVAVDDEVTRRERLAAWITSPDNRYFARSYVNRLWAYLTGVGIIEPIDDIRAGNPPTNPQLLDWLTEQFIDSGFDTRHIIKTICKSRTYQLSIETNPWNEDDQINFSHAQARRLPAEVLYDAIHVVTGSKSDFPNVPAGTRAAELPDVAIKLPDGFLANLGRPARESACECERVNEVQLGPVMALVNGPTVGDALADPHNALPQLVERISDDRQLFNELFLRVLNRPARDAEIDAAMETMDAMEEEHQAMTERLARAEQLWKPKEAELESRRWAKIGAAEAELLAYQDKTRAEVERKKQERLDDIAQAEAALASYENEIPLHLLEWEYAEEQATRWRALDLLSLNATNGADLAKQDDGSVFASGKNGRGNYDVAGDTPLRLITGIKIEALPDERLPNGGPGRADDGNFVLTELKVQWADPNVTEEKELAKWNFETDAEGWTASEQTKLEAGDGVLNIVSSGNDPMITRAIEADGSMFMLEFEAKLSGNHPSQLFWTTKSKAEFEEANSVRLTLTGDGQWLAYRYYFRAAEALTGLRLDPSDKPGSLQLRRLRLHRIEEPQYKDVALVDAQADYSQEDYAVQSAIDGRNPANNNGWAVGGAQGKPHQAIFAFKEPVATSFGASLKISLMQNFNSNKHSLGRFRISLTSSPLPLDYGLPDDVRDILDVASTARNDEQQERLVEYFRKFDRGLLQLRAAIDEAKQPLPEDPELKRLEAAVAEARQPITIDPALVRLRREVKISGEQLQHRRLTAAQDVAWALINSPAFLFNR